MKTIFYLLMLSTIAAASCKKDPAATPAPAPAPVVPPVDSPAAASRTNLLLTISDPANGLLTTLTYDGANRLKTFSRNSNAYNPSRYYTFAYDAAGKLTDLLETADSTPGAATTDSTHYSYGADGKLAKKEYYRVWDPGSAELQHVYEYTYTPGKVDELYLTVSSGTGFRQVYTVNDSGNVTLIEVYTGVTTTNHTGTFDGSITYSNYDNKRAIQESFPDAFLFPGNNANNVGAVAYSWGGYSYTYEYNEDGYPTKRVDGGAATTYTYQRL